MAFIAFFSAQLCTVFATLLITGAIPLGSGQTQAVVYDPGNLPQPAGSTGQELWRYGPLGWDEPTSPVLGRGVAYVFTGDALLALDAGTGELRWRVGDDDADGIRLVSEGIVYMTDGDRLFAFEATSGGGSGSEKWRAGLDNFNPVSDAIVATPDTVYVQMIYGGAIDSILAIDAASGHQRWRFDTESCLWSIEAGSESAYAVTLREELCALDAQSGEQKWCFSESMYLSRLHIVGSWEIDRWESATDQGVPFGDLVVVEDSIYISHGAGLYRLDAQTGAKRWSFGLYQSGGHARVARRDASPERTGRRRKWQAGRCRRRSKRAGAVAVPGSFARGPAARR